MGRLKIGILTSSRADFGVYLALLKAFRSDKDIEFEIIAFGTHLSHFHGYTVNDIEKEYFHVKHKVASIISDDSENAIATSAALTSLKFGDFWANHKNDFDIVLCLGDRFEMFSAVISGIPYGIKFAHFYGGDYSKGAIDNIYRDSMSHCSIMHFTSNQECANRVNQMINNMYPIRVIGSLSIEELENMELLTIEEFYDKWDIDLIKSTILVTFHPETIQPENNLHHSEIIFNALSTIQKSHQLVITMPNADTNGILYRKSFEKLKKHYTENIHLIENFGLQSYFTCMKYSKLMIGNTSSGISESATFNKYFISIGDRQKGRQAGLNIISCPFEETSILLQFEKAIKLGDYQGENVFKKEGAIQIIIESLKSLKH